MKQSPDQKSKCLTKFKHLKIRLPFSAIADCQWVFCFHMVLFPGEFLFSHQSTNCSFYFLSPTPTTTWRRGEKIGKWNRKTACTGTAVRMPQCYLGLTDVYTKSSHGYTPGFFAGFPHVPPTIIPKMQKIHSEGYTTFHQSPLLFPSSLPPTIPF